MKKLFLISLLFSIASCGEEFEQQKILLSFPELSSMTVGQVHPFAVGLNLSAEGGEIMMAKSSNGLVSILPIKQTFYKWEDYKTFNITGMYPGKSTIIFSMDDLKEDLNVWVFPKPKD